MNYQTCKEIEVAVAYYFGIRTNVIVPNVSWGLLPFECDLAVLTSSDYLNEIEIKISKHDLVRDKDKQKWKWGTREKIRKLWFAMPAKLTKHAEHVPAFAGILSVSEDGFVVEIRAAEVNRAARKLSPQEKFTLARLGCMRVWNLKRNIQKRMSAVPVIGEKGRSE